MENSNVTSLVVVDANKFGVVQRGGVNDNFTKIEFYFVPQTAVGDPTKKLVWFPLYRKELTLKQAKNEIFYFKKYDRTTGTFGETFDLETNFSNEILRPLSRTAGSTQIDGYIAIKYVAVPNTAYDATKLPTSK
jgi:hypothetical protein